MKREGALKIIRKLTNELKKINFIEAIYGIGSISNDNFDKYSDVDLIVLVNKKINDKDILPHLKNYKILHTNKEFPYRVDFSIGELKIMLFCGLYDWTIKEIIKKSNQIKIYDVESQTNLIMMKRSIIFLDKRNLLKKFQKKIPEYQKGMRKFIMKERMEKLNYYLFIKI